MSMDEIGELTFTQAMILVEQHAADIKRKKRLIASQTPRKKGVLRLVKDVGRIIE